MAKEFRYTVKGHWPFPTDMLRYDGSQAATPKDQALIDKLSTEHAEDRDAFTDVEINLVGPNKPNTARWESFRWTVPSDEEHAFYKELNARRRGQDRLVKSALSKLDSAEREAIEARMTTAHH